MYNSYRNLKQIFLMLIAASFLLMSARGTDPNYKLIVFEGSDWCVKCIRLEEQVLLDSQFIQFTQLHQIELERIDFPQRKQLDQKILEYNETVAEKLQFDGAFPTLFLIDSKSNTIHKLSYVDPKPEKVISLLRAKIAPSE